MSHRNRAWFCLIWAVVFSWDVGASRSLAVELIKGPAVQTTDTTAVIRWKTDVVCGTRVRYGLSEDKMDGRAGEGVTNAHEVTLTGLKPDTAYAYSIGTAKVALKNDIFVTAKASTPGLLTKIKNAVGGKKASDEAKPPAPASTAAAKRTAPPTQRTWGSMRTLQDHFDRHGADFRATSPDDYARQAWEFLQRAKDEGLPAKVDDSDGTLRVWDPKSRAFAAYNRDGTTKTYFKPGSPDYFARQPGRAVNLRRTE